jgi:hypothetical protein
MDKSGINVLREVTHVNILQKTFNVTHTNFKLGNWLELEINAGSGELLWPTLIRLFSVVNFSVRHSLAPNLSTLCHFGCGLLTAS